MKMVMVMMMMIALIEARSSAHSMESICTVEQRRSV